MITLEEHFATPGFLDGPGRELKDQVLKYNMNYKSRKGGTGFRLY